MRIHIGSDHAGLELKATLVEYLKSKGHDVNDHGPHEYDAVDDYPDFCIPAAIATVADPSSLGIVLGGSGNGEQIAANKVKGSAISTDMGAFALNLSVDFVFSLHANNPKIRIKAKLFSFLKLILF